MTPSPSPFMRLHEVVERVRLSRWTLWRMVSEGLFPPPVRASRGRAYYLTADIDRWIATRRPDPGIVAGRSGPLRSAPRATPTSPARARKQTPTVHELLLRSGRPTRFPRQAAAAATRRRLFEPAAPTPAALSVTAARKGLAE